MAGKVSLTLMWTNLENKKATISQLLNVKWDYPIKKPYISLIIGTRGSECENNL